MSEQQLTARPTFAPGAFCWADLGTPDQEGAKRFYSALFGWDVFDAPMGDGGSYSMLRQEERDVAALYQQTQEGVPPSWLPYVSVESADRAAERAVRLGGELLMEPLDVFTAGRMAVVRDPTGAALALWEGREHPGFGLLGQPGTPCWLELATDDPDRAGSFYSELLPWQPEEMQVAGAQYTVFHAAGQPTAGMMRKPEEASGVPSHWLVYFYAADCDASAERTWELGGRVLVPPTDIPGIGRFAVLQDPQGATFCLLTPLPQE